MKRFLSLLAAMALAAVGVSSTAQADVLYSLNKTNLSTYDTAVAPPTRVSRADFGGGAWCFGLAVDSSLNVYAADQLGGKVTKTTPGGLTTTFGSFSGGEMPGGLAVSPAGDIYLSMWWDAGVGTIYKYTPSGSRSLFATGPAGALGMAFAPDGTLYVGTNSAITKYDAAGVGTTFSTAIGSVYGLAFDASGVLWGTSANAGSLSKFDMGTGAATAVAFGLNSPSGLAFDSTGQLYVASYSSSKILNVTAGGSVTTYADRTNPTGLAFSPVPLPTTAAMGLLGAGLTLIRRRRAAKAS